MQELLDLTQGHPERRVAAGDVLVTEGQAGDRLYVLVEGRLMVQRGGEDFAAIDAPGACVGEMAVLLRRPHTASVVAVEPSVVRVVENAAAVVEHSPAILGAVAVLLARRLDLINRYVGDLQHQYRDHEGGLGMVGDVLRTLASHHGDDASPGSNRDPEPLY